MIALEHKMVVTISLALRDPLEWSNSALIYSSQGQIPTLATSQMENFLASA